MKMKHLLSAAACASLLAVAAGTCARADDAMPMKDTMQMKPKMMHHKRMMHHTMHHPHMMKPMMQSTPQ